MQIIDLNKPKPPQESWQSGLFWVDVHKVGDTKRAVLSWPQHCQSVAFHLPPDCETMESALEYLKSQMIESLNFKNGVMGK
jgi:hypothetical protein